MIVINDTILILKFWGPSNQVSGVDRDLGLSNYGFRMDGFRYDKS